LGRRFLVDFEAKLDVVQKNPYLYQVKYRQSTIVNLLKSGNGLQAVQYFAGHKKISSMKKYRQTGLEELKAAIMKYHPFQ
jgi:site-specific recombinase XerD